MMKMADPTQYTFTFEELAKPMFKSANIHQGKWVVGIEYNVAIAHVGLKPDEAFPGAIIGAQRILISAATEAPTPPNLTFDAAKLNPVGKTKKE
jgi:hypothetical protein